MKSIYALAFILSSLSSLYAQEPVTYISYSSAIRGTNGQALPNKTVGFRFSILKGTASGEVVYRETHSTKTDQWGAVSLSIGAGTTLDGSYSALDWGSANHFLMIELDHNGGSNYQQMGVIQFLAVPYALHARTAQTVSNLEESDPVFTSSISKGITAEDTAQWNNSARSHWTFSNGSLFYNAGKVGIGTATPRSFLDVVSNEANSQYTINASSTNAKGQAGMAIWNNVNGWLKVALLGDQVEDGDALGVAGPGTVQILSQYGAKDMLVGTLNNQSLIFGTNNLPRLMINPAGRVGIGTSSFPNDIATPLSIKGFDSQNLNTSDLVQFSDENNNRRWHFSLYNNTDFAFNQTGTAGSVLHLKSGGNVGVGTQNPASKLSVNGTIESLQGGIKFPDGSIQQSACTSCSDNSGSFDNDITIGAPAGSNYTRVYWTRLNSGTDSLVYKFAPGQWYYFALVKQSTGAAKVYLNGVEMLSGNFANEAFAHNQLYFAAKFFSTIDSFFKGSIDGVRVSNKAKTATEINSYWKTGTAFSAEPNTFALWNMDEGTGNSFASSVGNYTATLSGNPAWINGKFGKAISFDGIDDYGVSNLTLPTGNVTYETWVRFDADITRYTSILQPYGLFNIGLEMFPSTVQNNEGIILKSANGKCWKVTIDDDGNFLRAQVPCAR